MGGCGQVQKFIPEKSDDGAGRRQEAERRFHGVHHWAFLLRHGLECDFPFASAASQVGGKGSHAVIQGKLSDYDPNQSGKTPGICLRMVSG